ncbi:MAG: 4'-phosphopantetheinyl transferase superfamily protein [Parafilimonas sp.]
MISIGNDIIALERTNAARSKQEKFYSKILCRQENALFKNINSDILSIENFVWLAWSVKESVYKFYTRTNQQALFSPTKIVIQKIKAPLQQEILEFDNAQLERNSFNNETCFCCEIQFASDIFYTRTLVFDDIIFSVANNTNCFENIYWGIKNIDDDSYEAQSAAVREFTLKGLNKFLLSEELTIEKSLFGYPFISKQNQIPLSFTHHGNYVAYSFKQNGK